MEFIAVDMVPLHTDKGKRVLWLLLPDVFCPLGLNCHLLVEAPEKAYSYLWGPAPKCTGPRAMPAFL